MKNCWLADNLVDAIREHQKARPDAEYVYFRDIMGNLHTVYGSYVDHNGDIILTEVPVEEIDPEKL